MKDLCLKDIRVFEMIKKENLRQIEKWGVQDRDPFEWLAYITEEVGELSKAISEWNYRMASPIGVIKEAIQVTTLSLKIAEMFLNRTEAKNG